MQNEYYGGPMLMRVPPASLADVKAYSDKLQQIGYPYYGVVTRIGFDPTAEYPKLTFTPVRALSEAEAEIILAHRDGSVVERILNTAVDEVHTDGTDKTHSPEIAST